MTYKDLTDRYAGSALGVFWALFYPLLLVGIYVLIFTFIFKVNLGGQVQSQPLEYALYAIVGLVAFISMQEGLVRSTSSILSNATLVKQVVFPIDILPIIGILVSFTTLVIGFVIYLFISATLVREHLSVLALLLPLVIFLHFIFSVGIGWILAGVAAYFRDLKELITIFLFLGMFVTPVLYSDQMVPAALYWPFQINPMTHLINMYRDVLFYGHINHPWSFLVFSILSIVIFLLGFSFFQKVKHFFANIL